MTMKPGCGCLLILLAIGNLVLAVSSIAAAIRGNLTVLAGVGTTLLFIANVIAVGMLGLAAFRGVSIGGKRAGQHEDESTGAELTSVGSTEGTEEGED